MMDSRRILDDGLFVTCVTILREEWQASGGTNQAELARQAGLSPATLSPLFAAQRRPHLETLQRLLQTIRGEGATMQQLQADARQRQVEDAVFQHKGFPVLALDPCAVESALMEQAVGQVPLPEQARMKTDRGIPSGPATCPITFRIYRELAAEIQRRVVDFGLVDLSVARRYEQQHGLGLRYFHPWHIAVDSDFCLLGYHGQDVPFGIRRQNLDEDTPEARRTVLQETLASLNQRIIFVEHGTVHEERLLQLLKHANLKVMAPHQARGHALDQWPRWDVWDGHVLLLPILPGAGAFDLFQQGLFPERTLFLGGAALFKSAYDCQGAGWLQVKLDEESLRWSLPQDDLFWDAWPASKRVVIASPEACTSPREWDQAAQYFLHLFTYLKQTKYVEVSAVMRILEAREWSRGVSFMSFHAYRDFITEQVRICNDPAETPEFLPVV